MSNGREEIVSAVWSATIVPGQLEAQPARPKRVK